MRFVFIEHRNLYHSINIVTYVQYILHKHFTALIYILLFIFNPILSNISIKYQI